MANNLVLELDDVSRSFAGVRAVDSLSFVVEEGSVFGLLGPNGAGKTTTLRIILNILKPDSGNVRMLGRDLASGLEASVVGYLPEERGLYEVMTTRDQLAFLAELKGLTRSEAASASAQWIERLGLDSRAGTRIRDLSKGQRQLVQFAGAMLHSPRLLVLDEPFSGLDPVATNSLKKILFELVGKGTAVLLSTHMLEHAADLCSRVCIMLAGREVESGTPEQICQRSDTLALEAAFVKLAGPGEEAGERGC